MTENSVLELQKQFDNFNTANASVYVAQCTKRGRERFIIRKNNIENKDAILFVFHKNGASELYILPARLIINQMQRKGTKTAMISVKTVRKMVILLKQMEAAIK